MTQTTNSNPKRRTASHAVRGDEGIRMSPTRSGLFGDKITVRTREIAEAVGMNTNWFQRSWLAKWKAAGLKSVGGTGRIFLVRDVEKFIIESMETV